VILEQMAAGWGIADRANRLLVNDAIDSILRLLPAGRVTTLQVATAAQEGDAFAAWLLDTAIAALAEAIRQMITLLCPRRIIIGGGVSLMGEERFFVPLRGKVATEAFAAFAGLTDIVPAALGEEVVVHGALALARKKLGS
jgi:glucokinase